MTSFDADVFENAVIEQEMETKYTPLDESSAVGAYTGCFIDKYEFREANDSPILRAVWRGFTVTAIECRCGPPLGRVRLPGLPSNCGGG